MSAASILFDERVLGIFAAAAGVAAYAFTAFQVLRRSRERRWRRQMVLHGAISKGLVAGTLDSVEDFVNIYKGVHALGADDISYRAGLGKALREYLVHLVGDESIGVDLRRSLKEKINRVLLQIEAESPFADLPAAERNLLVDVQRFLSAGDQSSAARKLQDLAGLIEARQDALERLQASNKWSMPLAVIGLVLTIIFGVISLVK
ncbi:MAG: hypothetical protein K0S57_3528 [Ramlibacter sp.]|jgi:hypothetical protein|nr:hypothetical protein [Ramlibacter sp.]